MVLEKILIRNRLNFFIIIFVSRLFNGEKLSSSERIRVERTNNKHSLIIGSAEETHAGAYTLTASNEVGKDVVSVQLIVEGRFICLFLCSYKS